MLLLFCTLPGNFHPSEGGEVLKRYNAVENTCLEVLMSDALRQFVPQYYGLASRGEDSYMRLEDLLSGQICPVIMDCKMGVRTFLEEELMKARHNPSLRSDMYQKMVKVDPSAPSEKEHAQKAVTKQRYMQWRDNVSSTSTLGFRIEGITTENGKVLRDFKMTQTSAQVAEALLSFTNKQPSILVSSHPAGINTNKISLLPTFISSLEAYLSRLSALHEALKESEFFRTHEIIGSSLLFIHDRTSRANIWMIDFGKTLPVPSGLHLGHDIPWTEGNREDGYLIGLTTLTSMVTKALEQSQGTGLSSCAVEPERKPQTQTWSMSREVIPKSPRLPLLEESDSKDTGLEEVLSGDLLGSSATRPECKLECSTFLTSLEYIATQSLQSNSVPESHAENSLPPNGNILRTASMDVD
ncbi:hypothetical protein Z043_103291 [Scleropages formosus]|uniref:Kinase n=1 Tax=Scleropages formosus TaxID=113540 RepID=A0A0N8K2B8_SCLFO|nr:hypothetical protein Z043_103291 [Scleropages formosus]